MDGNKLLKDLLQKGEGEIIEFKEAKNDYDLGKISKYVSAIANEAYLAGKNCGYLVFGIKDNKEIIGTNYRNGKNLNTLKKEVSRELNNAFSPFREILEFYEDDKRIIILVIPSAFEGEPVAYQGHFFGREGDELKALSIHKFEKIRNKNIKDFSKEICEGATIDDLEIKAIEKARENYKVKNPRLKDEIDLWDNITFLNKAKITIGGKITKTAILLLGKSESEHFLEPGIAKISWILKDRDGIEKDYEHFSCPFILSVEEVYKKIRNGKYRYINKDSIFPEEVDMYDSYVIREALHNCIAHQDYTMGGKINLIENEDSLVFSNLGEFIPGNLDNVIMSDSPSEYYRNKFLADAMVSLNMIDTIGSGIKKMYTIQKDRLFPLPDYEFEDKKVKLKIIGKILDINYAKKLIQCKEDLKLNDIILLDRIQKKQDITDNQAKYLKKYNFIEGRKPNYHISLKIANNSELMSDYILNKMNTKEQKDKILDFIKGYKKGVEKSKILNFIKQGKIYEIGLTDLQIENRLSNQLQYLKEKGKIFNKGQGKSWKWYEQKI